MKKKKFLAMLLSGCLMVSLLSGCGSSGESADSGASDGGSDASAAEESTADSRTLTLASTLDRKSVV